jgi:hypothetical protein
LNANTGIIKILSSFCPYTKTRTVQPAANSPTAKFLILVPSPPELPVKHVDIQALENYFHQFFDF